MKQNKDDTLKTLCLTKVCKRYEKITAVNDVSFSTVKGEVIALLGPNGAGKSTLMNMIAGFLTPTNGNIKVNNRDVETEDILVKKDIGFLPEGAPMYADMSVRLFLEYMIALKINYTETVDLNKKKIRELYNEEFRRICAAAKIEDIIDQKIETLSKGYLRRVGFAQSIIGNPPILLLDEPTDGLDPNQKEHIRALISEMGKNKTLVISTHLLDEAESIATRILLINKGKIIADGSLKDILHIGKSKNLEQAFKTLTQQGEQ